MPTLACVTSSAVALETLGEPVGRWPRAERLRAEDRRDFLAARQLTVALATRLTGRSWAATDLHQSCGTCGGVDHGKPALGTLSVSWSHAAGTVAAAVSDDRRVAIDIQRIADAPAVREVLAETSAGGGADPVSAWVVREALVKLGVVSLSEAVTLSGREVAALAAPGSISWVDPTTECCVALGVRRRLPAKSPHQPEIVDIIALGHPASPEA
ncbi:hypothetical protein [Nocardioides sp.]|uniref:4'-phosphopantetheinyl transferase family protein n=1 Tax=Nocardioides sp. TaxID=35761 RepID=UPI002ED8A63B